MIIIQDTREQLPLDFKPHQAVVEVAKLDTGDYSVKGHEADVCVERKSIHDLVNTIIHSKKRFGREMDRMRLIAHRVIIVEGTLRDIHLHRYRSMVHPNAVLGMCNWITVSTQTPIVWCDDPQMSAWWVESWFRQVMKRGVKNGADKAKTAEVL